MTVIAHAPVAFGAHLGEPKRGPANVTLADVIGGNFGLTFEDQDLRARAVIDRRPRQRQ